MRKENDEEKKHSIESETEESGEKNLSGTEMNDIVKKEEEIQELRLKLSESEKVANDYFNYLQRLQADFENYKKRMLKEREGMRLVFLESFAMELFRVADDFERALKAGETAEDINAILSGTKMIYKQILDFLKRNNIEPVVIEKDALFDPSLHDAVAFEEVENEKDEGKITEEYEKGYRLSGKVIRPAKVKVTRCVKKNEAALSKEEETLLH